MRKVAFLLFHHIHHAPHVLPTAKALARISKETRVSVFSSSAQSDSLCARILDAEDGIELVRVARANPLPRGYNFPDPQAAMQESRARLADMDAVVTSSFEDLDLKLRHGLRQTKFACTFHGAGDRAYGFSTAVDGFDLLLLAGKKGADRLNDAGLLAGKRWAITGYPKFDLATAPAASQNNKTALYNPHWSPELSSWSKFGAAILDYFADKPSWRLIFAPHILLTGPTRRLDLSKYRDCENIHIDTGSLHSVDMTYVDEAQLYIGDVSSQVYEFLRTPRPCLFLNRGVTDWQIDPNYWHWQCGTVWNDPKTIGEALIQALERHEELQPVQEQLFQYTFDLKDVPSAHRTAEAIMSFLQSTRSKPIN
jgi:hypothetical protein